MKTIYALLLTAIVAVLTLIILGQITHYVKTEPITKKNDISSITDNIKGKNIEIDKMTRKAIMIGTNYNWFDVTSFTNEREIDSTRIEVNSSLKKIFPIYSQSMMNRFNDSFLLDENGGYLFTPNFNVDMRYQTMQFKYKVK